MDWLLWDAAPGAAFHAFDLLFQPRWDANIDPEQLKNDISDVYPAIYYSPNSA